MEGTYDGHTITAEGWRAGPGYALVPVSPEELNQVTRGELPEAVSRMFAELPGATVVTVVKIIAEVHRRGT